MPPEYSRSASSSPAPAPSHSISRHLSLLVLRLTTGGALMFWHGWREGITAWSHIWHKTAWDLPGQLASLGFPFSVPLAITLVVITLLGSLFLMIGLLTRISAVILGLMTASAAVLYKAYPAISENAFLYAGACLAICLAGAGTYALDRLLRAMTKRRV